jgi:pre-60S factor REI1
MTSVASSSPAAVTPVLTSTTAPGKVFATRGELAEHYKSDWHKYNLKRREAGLPLLGEVDFQARWEAALALRQEKEKSFGTDHIKNEKKKKQAKQQQQLKKKLQQKQNASTDHNGDKVMEEPTPKPKQLPDALAKSQENPDIDPKQSLFDSHRSETLKGNIEYMEQKYGFFIPDKGLCL